MLRLCDRDKWEPVDLEQWVADKLSEKTPAARSNDFVNKMYEGLKPDGEKLKIVTISDLHVDYDYTPGMSHTCTKPICCRSDSGLPATPDLGAGKWGDFRCDMTPWTLDSLFVHLREEVKPDVVFWVGDSIPHNVESLTFESNVQIMKNVTKAVEQGLVDHGFKVIPVIGNHDTYPQDSMKDFKARDNKAVDEWAPTWKPFIENPEAMKTFLDYGYYSLPMTSADDESPGKVISLNSNVCYYLNFDAFIRFSDPGNML